MAAKIYTRMGDDGTTGLLGTGERRRKDALRVEAYGTVDEINAALGAALAGGLDGELGTLTRRLQGELFELGADLAAPAAGSPGSRHPAFAARHVEALEQDIDRLSQRLPPLSRFILPGGSPGASALHLARTVCRRAERRCVALAAAEAVGPEVLRYLNRLGDLLFVMARWENRARGIEDVPWVPTTPSL